MKLTGRTYQEMAADRGCNAYAAQDSVAKKIAARFIAVRRFATRERKIIKRHCLARIGWGLRPA